MRYGYEYYGLKMEQGAGIACELAKQTGVQDRGTLMLWFYVSDSNTVKGLISQEDGIDIGIAFDTLYVSYNGEAEASKPVLLKNIWNHLAVVLFDSGIEVFLNGVSVLRKDFSGLVFTAKTLTIGSQFFGYLRNVVLYKNALITDEIQHVMYHPEGSQPVLLDCDFTSNPPMEKVSNQPIPLPQRAQIVCLAPSAVLDNFAYFRCVESSISPWLDVNRAFSIQAWLNFSPNELEDYYAVFSNLDQVFGGGVELGILRRDDGYKVCAFLGTADVPVLESASGIPAGEWKNIALVCDRNTLRVYVDGVLDSQAAVETRPQISEKSLLLIGARASAIDDNGNFWYHGSMARLDVWRTALTQEQVLEYAQADPEVAAEDLLASWSFLEANIFNLVSGIPLGKVDSVRISQQEKASAANTCECTQALRTHSDAVPVLPAELIKEARRASGILEYMKQDDFQPKMTLITTCAYNDQIYFLCHDISESYPITAIQADADEVTVWSIELVLIIVEGILSYFLSLKVTYSEALAQYIRNHILCSPSIRAVIGAIAARGNITMSGLMTIAKEIICSGKLSPMLRMACECSFWLIVSFVFGITRRFLSGSVEIVIFLGILLTRVGFHVARFPQANTVQLEEVLFCHDTPEKICSIHICKNRRETWKLPEWVNGRAEVENAPAVYRLARFSKNGDVLEIKAKIRTVNFSKETIYYEIRAVGSEPFGTSEIQTVTCPPGENNHTLFFKFKDAGEAFEKNGIMQYELSLSWEYRKSDANTDVLEFVRFQLSKHRIYSILDSVNLPWGPAVAEYDVNGVPVKVYTPMTELYDKTIDLVRGANTPGDAKRRIESGLYTSGHFLYNGTASIGAGAMIDPGGFEDWLNDPGTEPFWVNCLDCAVLMISIANLYGCNLKYVMQNKPFKLAGSIKLIGEHEERLPVSEGGGEGWFSYHYVSVDGDLGLNDPTQLSCYDPCLMYHNRTNQALRLASDVQFSASAHPEQQTTLPQTETYLECVMEISNDGIRRYNISGGPMYFSNFRYSSISTEL